MRYLQSYLDKCNESNVTLDEHMKCLHDLNYISLELTDKEFTVSGLEEDDEYIHPGFIEIVVVKINDSPGGTKPYNYSEISQVVDTMRSYLSDWEFRLEGWHNGIQSVITDKKIQQSNNNSIILKREGFILKFKKSIHKFGVN